jgi:hypothetical protein
MMMTNTNTQKSAANDHGRTETAPKSLVDKTNNLIKKSQDLSQSYSEDLAGAMIRRVKNLEDKFTNLLQRLPENYVASNYALINLSNEANNLWKAIAAYEKRR